LKNLFELESRIFITTPFKASQQTANELIELGYKPDAVKDNAIELKGKLSDCMNMNVNLRTASKVLWMLFACRANDATELYTRVEDYPWEDIIEVDGYFSINSFTSNSTINTTLYTNLKVKDAIADRFMRKFNKRPDSGPEKNGVMVYVHWIDSHVAIYLDTSGETLARHGYRKIPMKAPLQENLAASIIMATGWKGDSHFINPMCGSGTLAIEAALIMMNKANGLIKKDFAIRYVIGFKQEMLDKYIDEAIEKVKKSVDYKIIATDISEDAVESSKINAGIAGVEHIIEFKVARFENTNIPEGEGVLIMNPPYGERIGDEEKLQMTYKTMGDFFKQRCQGYNAYVLTGNPELAKFIGLKPKRKIPFFNAKIECRLLHFEIYSGSKKASKNDYDKNKEKD
jgi:putative N6-adenine-specific DNA methylase